MGDILYLSCDQNVLPNQLHYVYVTKEIILAVMFVCRGIICRKV